MSEIIRLEIENDNYILQNTTTLCEEFIIFKHIVDMILIDYRDLDFYEYRSMLCSNPYKKST